MRPDFHEPSGKLTADLVLDMLGLVTDPPPPLEIIKKWTKMELLMAYDWAVREHMAASDNIVKRRERPWFTTIMVHESPLPQWLGHEYQNALGRDDYCIVEVGAEEGSIFANSCSKPKAAHGPRPSGDNR